MSGAFAKIERVKSRGIDEHNLATLPGHYVVVRTACRGYPNLKPDRDVVVRVAELTVEPPEKTRLPT